MDVTSSPSDVLLTATSLQRRFGATIALSDCSLSVRRGTVHAVIGENGSGKSTLVKILSGVLGQDSGMICVGGTERPAHFSVSKARLSGLGTVFQEILILGELSVLDNIWLGHHSLYHEYLPHAERVAIAAQVLTRLMGPDAPRLQDKVNALDLGTRQAITIARSLVLNPKLLILDEATSALDIRTRDRLFDEVKRMTATGQSVLLITHKMDEIAVLADEVSVLRDGLVIRTMPVADATPTEMLALMSGHREHAVRKAPVQTGHQTALFAKDILLNAAAVSFSIGVVDGEVLGLASLEGHGGDAFAKILSGLYRPMAGNVRDMQGKPLLRRSDFRAAKVTYVPRDRKTEGIFAGLSLRDNFAISTLADNARAGVILDQPLNQRFTRFANQVALRFQTASQPIRQLSGGNQQKIILARAIATKPRVLVLNDPTRGVDQNTKIEIHAELRSLAATGVAIVIHSTEVEELAQVCNRIAIFHANQLHRILEHQDVQVSSIVRGMFGRAA